MASSLRARLSAIALLAVVGYALVPAAEAEKPIRIGATLSLTGAYASATPNLHRSYQLYVKQTNERGGILGRPLELLVYDDASDAGAAIRLYEKLIVQDKVDLVLGPYSSRIADAVADVTEKHRLPMVAPVGAATSIYRKGRRYIFSMFGSSESQLEGLVDLAAKKGLKSLALIHVDDVGDRLVRQGTIELAKKNGLRVAIVESFPIATADFAAILSRVRAASPDVLGISTGSVEDGAAIIRQLKALNVNLRMIGFTPGSGNRLYELAGRDAEFAYSASLWLPELVEVRAGGLIPIARQYPGAREFVESWNREFPGATPHAPAYGACQVLGEAIKRAGSLDGTKIRDVISKMDYNTVFGPFRVDRDGVQIAHKGVLFQWQDAKRAIVWPEELAPSQPRFPTPPWNQRP
jgi:branched-chain amino acid transport system substrate-binding protein